MDSTYAGCIISVVYLEARMNIETLRIKFNTALTQLEDKLDTLSRAVVQDDADLPALMVGEGVGSSREACSAIYRKLEYSDEQAYNETVTAIGAMAASNATLKLASEINELKLCLAQIKKAMARHNVPHPERYGSQLPLYDEHIRYKLRRPRLHFTQLRRHILVLEQYSYPPRRIGFVMTRGETKVQPITWDTARNRLSRKAEQPGIVDEMALLDSLPQDELFAHVIPSPPHARANLAWVNPDDHNQVTRAQRSVSMPLLYPYSSGDEPPLISGPVLSSHRRAERLDVKIESVPICPSIRVYRYKKTFRKVTQL